MMVRNIVKPKSESTSFATVEDCCGSIQLHTELNHDGLVLSINSALRGDVSVSVSVRNKG